MLQSRWTGPAAAPLEEAAAPDPASLCPVVGKLAAELSNKVIFEDGMQKLLNILYVGASVRSGVNSGALGSSNANHGNDRLPAEVLTTAEKQVAYHSCFALRQYFRAHLLQLVDSIRPNKSIRSIARNTSSARAGYKPFDIGNEAMDAIFRQIQRDKKLGPALVRTRWPVMDKFLVSNEHITMLELCQGLPSDRYLHDLAQYAFGVLHIITLMPHSHKLIVAIFEPS